MKKVKKTVALFMTMLLTLVLFVQGTVSVEAATTSSKKTNAVKVWSGKVDKSWFTGKKTSYNISTAEQLAGLAAICNEHGDEQRFEGVEINLTNDIVLNDTTNWENWTEKAPKNVWDPIGKIGSPLLGYCNFMGIFNGNGHTISGMYVAPGEEGGLFCFLGAAVVTNVRIEKSVIVNGGTSSGALAGVVESSYIENCEAEDIIIKSEGHAGGLIGASENINCVVPFLTTVMLGFGIVLNPLYLKAMESETGSNGGTYLVNCKANRITVNTERQWGANSVGGVVGLVASPTGIYNCLSMNTKFSSKDTVNYGGSYSTGLCGGVYGSIDEGTTTIIKNNYCYDFKRTDGNKDRSDKKDVKGVTKSKLTSKAFAKKLGKGYAAVSKDAPKIKTIITKNVLVGLKGSNGYVSFKPVDGAKQYRVYVKYSNGKIKSFNTKSTTAKITGLKKGKACKIWVKSIAKKTPKTIKGSTFTLKM